MGASAPAEERYIALGGDEALGAFGLSQKKKHSTVPFIPHLVVHLFHVLILASNEP